MQATFENEFSLFTQEEDGSYAPLDTALCFSSIAMTEAADVIDDMVAAFAAQGIPVDAYYPELGHGQHELPLRHTPALRAADNQIWFRETVRNVAHSHGLTGVAGAQAHARPGRQRLPHPLEPVGSGWP